MKLNKHGTTEKSDRKVVIKLKRMFDLYFHLGDSHGFLKIAEFCKKHQISERTLRRDIALLKEILPGTIVNYDRCWSRKLSKE